MPFCWFCHDVAHLFTITYVFFFLGCHVVLSPNQRTIGPVNAHLTPGPGIYFNAFIHVYNPRAGTDNPLGTNVDVNRKPYHFAHLLQVLKQSL